GWRSGWNHSDMPANQIDRKLRQSIELTLSPAKFERNVLAFDVSGLLEALAKSAQIFREGFERWGGQKLAPRARRPLRAGGERPRRRRAAEQRDELAPSHTGSWAENLARLPG